MHEDTCSKPYKCLDERMRTRGTSQERHKTGWISHHAHGVVCELMEYGNHLASACPPLVITTEKHRITSSRTPTASALSRLHCQLWWQPYASCMHVQLQINPRPHKHIPKPTASALSRPHCQLWWQPLASWQRPGRSVAWTLPPRAPACGRETWFCMYVSNTCTYVHCAPCVSGNWTSFPQALACWPWSLDGSNVGMYASVCVHVCKCARAQEIQNGPHLSQSCQIILLYFSNTQLKLLSPIISALLYPITCTTRTLILTLLLLSPFPLLTHPKTFLHLSRWLHTTWTMLDSSWGGCCCDCCCCPDLLESSANKPDSLGEEPPCLLAVSPSSVSKQR